MGYIYKLKCDDIPQVYIGQTKQTITRCLQRHKDMYKKYLNAFVESPEKYATAAKWKAPLYRAMVQYGFDKFHLELIMEAENSELAALEEQYIVQYKTREDGLNIHRGANRDPHSEEARANIKSGTKKAYERVDVLNNKRKYADKLEGLPHKCCYELINGRYAYRVRHHEFIPNKIFTVSAKRDEATAKAMLVEHVRIHTERYNARLAAVEVPVPVLPIDENGYIPQKPQNQ